MCLSGIIPGRRRKVFDESVDDHTDLGAPDCVSPADGMHDEVPQALQHLEKGPFGKIVIRTTDPASDHCGCFSTPMIALPSVK